MPVQKEIEVALRRVHDQSSFFNALLAETLRWPTREVAQVEDIAYGWSAEDLNAQHVETSLLDGSIWQIQPAGHGQPWGSLRPGVQAAGASFSASWHGRSAARRLKRSGRFAPQGRKATVVETGASALHLYPRLEEFSLCLLPNEA